MLVIRLLAVIIAVAIVANLLFWLFTGNRHYLGWAIRLGQFALFACLLLVVLLIAERFIAL